MLITHTKSSGNLLHFQSISKVCSQNVILVFIMRTVIIVKLIISLSCWRLFITIIFRRIITENIFRTGFKSMYLADRRRIISLESMFSSILGSIIMLIFHTFHKILPIRSYILHIIIISGVWIRTFRSGIDFIREGQHTIFYMKHTLVVNATINRIPGTFASIVRYILIQIITGTGHRCKSITQSIAVISATPKSERHGYQTQSINFITGFHAAGLEITMPFTIATII